MTYEESNARALREWNLLRPAWTAFLRIDQLTLGEKLWVTKRAQDIRFGTDSTNVPLTHGL